MLRAQVDSLKSDVADDREQWRKGIEKLDAISVRIFEKLDKIAADRIKDEHAMLIETRGKIWTFVGYALSLLAILASIWGAHLYFR